MLAIQCRSRPYVLFFLLLLILGIISCSYMPEYNDDKLAPSRPISQSVPIYTYRIVNTYTHDRNAFTQGLVFENNILYEGTGLYGNSSIRKVDLETGEVLQIYKLPNKYFGEGITVYKDTIIQLTLKSNLGFVYNKNNFDLFREFSYSTEGWGVTHDGDRIIMSDGTSILHFLDPETLKTIGYVEVHDNNAPINRINELEYINGEIYANVLQTDKIAIIEPYEGRVTGWIDLSGLLRTQDYSDPVDVLNGIAYDAQTDRLFVTGKLWPILCDIELVAKEQ